jgi:hypothetical protein
MSNILKGLNEGYFNRDEQDQQNAMDTRRSSDLSRERNAGLNEPDEYSSEPIQTRNGVYEYNVPTGQEKIAQELGLQLHKGHWFSRVPVQRANFQFGRPQFHEIPSKNVSEAEQDYGPEYQDKVQRLGQMAKQGERKTVYDPIKRVYKTVPVNSPKEQGVAEAELDEEKAKRTEEDIFHKGKKVGSITTTTTKSGMTFYTAQVGNSFVAGSDTREQALKDLKRLYRDSKQQGVAEGYKEERLKGCKCQHRQGDNKKCPIHGVQEGVAEDGSNAMSDTAKRLADKDDGKVAKLRAAGDKRREAELKGRNIAKRNEDAAGVGIITKQNTTKDVNKGTLRKMMKAYKLI